MKFKEKLFIKLKGKISDDELKYLPRSYQIVGDILLVKIKDELYNDRFEIGKAVLEILPYVKTVCLMKELNDVVRTPNIEIIAGENNTETIHSEHGCKFKIDVSKFMFSKGNKFEKQRLIGLVKKDEVIFDMFAGIGYWCIPVAKKAKKIYAIDINPEAVRYLKENISLNGLWNKLEVIEGDCRKVKIDDKADRIIMGWLFNTEEFLPYALNHAKTGTVIHMHRNASLNEVEKVKEKIIKICKDNGFEKIKIKINEVKSYAPKINHYVFDLFL